MNVRFQNGYDEFLQPDTGQVPKYVHGNIKLTLNDGSDYTWKQALSSTMITTRTLHRYLSHSGIDKVNASDLHQVKILIRIFCVSTTKRSHRFQTCKTYHNKMIKIQYGQNHTTQARGRRRRSYVDIASYVFSWSIQLQSNEISGCRLRSSLDSTTTRRFIPVYN